MKEVNLLWDKFVFGPAWASVSFRFRNLSFHAICYALVSSVKFSSFSSGLFVPYVASVLLFFYMNVCFLSEKKRRKKKRKITASIFFLRSFFLPSFGLKRCFSYLHSKNSPTLFFFSFQLYLLWLQKLTSTSQRTKNKKSLISA